MTKKPLTYADTGVNRERHYQLVKRIAEHTGRTLNRPGVVTNIGAFGGLFAPDLKKYPDPVLVSGTDGVGTKLKLAFLSGKHDTVGIDLVAMSVNDILCQGAEPLFFLDYIGTAEKDLEVLEQVVRGIADGCIQANCALIGGETAELPAMYAKGEYDLAGFAVGIVNRDRILTGEKVAAGDVLVGLAASGLHSNGYSLVRRVINHGGWALDRHVSEFSRTLGEELLEPTRVYAADCLDLARTFPVNGSAAGHAVHGFSHVTGGGLAANLARVLPQGLVATVDRATWQLPAIFRLVAELGNVPLADLERTLNLGVGMVAIVSPEAADAAVNRLNERGLPAWVMGTVEENSDSVVKTGPDYVQGAKGVDGGAVRLVNAYA